MLTLIKEGSDIGSIFARSVDLGELPYGLKEVKLPKIPASVKGAHYIGHGLWRSVEGGWQMTSLGDLTPFLPLTYSQTIQADWK